MYTKLTRQKKNNCFPSHSKSVSLLVFPIMTNHSNHLVIQGKNLEFVLYSYLHPTYSTHQYDLSALRQGKLNASTFFSPYWTYWWFKSSSSFSEYCNNILVVHHTSVYPSYYLFFNSSQNDLLNILMKICHLSSQSFITFYSE